MERHGSIIIFNDQPLGVGTTSRVVRGTFSGRSVAVKIVDSSRRKIIYRETDLLLHLDAHQNIIKYYTKEVGLDPISGNDNTYIALKEGVCNLVRK